MKRIIEDLQKGAKTDEKDKLLLQVLYAELGGDGWETKSAEEIGKAIEKKTKSSPIIGEFVEAVEHSASLGQPGDFKGFMANVRGSAVNRDNIAYALRAMDSDDKKEKPKAATEKPADGKKKADKETLTPQQEEVFKSAEKAVEAQTGDKGPLIPDEEEIFRSVEFVNPENTPRTRTGQAPIAQDMDIPGVGFEFEAEAALGGNTAQGAGIHHTHFDDIQNVRMHNSLRYMTQMCAQKPEMAAALAPVMQALIEADKEKSANRLNAETQIKLAAEEAKRFAEYDKQTDENSTVRISGQIKVGRILKKSAAYTYDVAKSIANDPDATVNFVRNMYHINNNKGR